MQIFHKILDLCQGIRKVQRGKILDILIRTRTVKALDEAALKNKAYQKTLMRQDKAYDALDKAGLNKEQRVLVDGIITAANDCGATYGAIAYELGLQDGIKLTSELAEIKHLWN